jgi:hypothetical protein
MRVSEEQRLDAAFAEPNMVDGVSASTMAYHPDMKTRPRQRLDMLVDIRERIE